jgi:hypothetical protein
MRVYPEGAQIVSATARVFGPQTTRVRAECSGGVQDGAYVCVQVGSTLVYAYDLAAVRSFRKAWEQAMARPMGLLIDKPKSLPAQRDYLTAVSVTVRSKQAFRVLAVGAEASIEKEAHVIVTVGPLTVVAYDRLAATSYADAWFKAERIGKSVLSDPEPDAVGEAIASATKAETRAFESGGPVPSIRS